MGSQDNSIPEELISPEMIDSFISETNDLLDNVEEALLEMEKDPVHSGDLINDAFRAVHTVKGNAGFFGFADIEQSCMDIESVMDNVRKGNKEATNNLITDLLENVDSVRGLLKTVGMKEAESASESTTVKAPDEAPPDVAPAGNTRAGGEPESAEEKPEEAQSQPGVEFIEDVEVETESDYKPLGDVLIEMGATTRDKIDHALDEQQKKLGEILVEKGVTQKDVVDKALQEQAKYQAAAKESAYAVKRKDIRVDMGKLDRLFDLMGELITAEAMVVSHPELEKLDIENFHKAANEMSKITRSMQEITMGIRMIPLEGLFNKMRRLVRDLARKFDKKINLSISGQDTEMDRNVIEEISDPLVHIIRNSIDHGVEGQEQREAAGKSSEGNIGLDAKYEGNEIWITISDDGGGLRRDKILAKAEKNNLLTGSPDELSDSDVWQLIFEPGFSTADQVSEISGRGVGMDVVRRNIEKLRGKIDIASTPGEGTNIVLKIPLTLAIIDAINFQVGTMQYSVPISDIVEFQKVTEEQVTRTSSEQEVLRLREEIIPIIKLHQFFDIETVKRKVSDGLVIIAQGRGKKIALLVDEIIGNQQIVIKPLPEYMAGMRAVSGCSIMGNGEVTLILDIGSLIREELD
jgi:two-component system, chemotaxis family, sensor kinase CheA